MDEAKFDRLLGTAATHAVGAGMAAIALAIVELSVAQRENLSQAGLVNDLIQAVLCWRQGDSYDTEYDSLLKNLGIMNHD